MPATTRSAWPRSTSPASVRDTRRPAGALDQALPRARSSVAICCEMADWV